MALPFSTERGGELLKKVVFASSQEIASPYSHYTTENLFIENSACTTKTILLLILIIDLLMWNF